MELLYRAAHKARYRRADGSVAPKFVYLDMEEYKDLYLTAAAFMQALEREGLENFSAGMVLQAYIPDSRAVQRRLNDWARRRVGAGGAPVTLRLVKGANMEMERVEASLRGWPQAPFKTKVETDANYKRMLEEGLRPENAAAVRLGVASHNLFDLAYALVLAQERGVLDRVHFEMLEGMANHQRRALHELTGSLLLYAPICRKEDFIHAIGYLIRRLDENTGPDNFLRHAFKIRVGGAEWEQLEKGFLRSCELKDSISDKPRRTQNRLREREGPLSPLPLCENWAEFVNEPDTDFALPHNVDWAERIVADWLPRGGARALEVPLVIGGVEVFEGREARDGLDPSRPGWVVGRWRAAEDADVERAVQCARADPDGWRRMSAAERSEALGRAAAEVRRARRWRTPARRSSKPIRRSRRRSISSSSTAPRR
jgi:RHH-type proline utilization regulon transcriptional repressor/proline dehydrogenase/delta 1-pyrroline-5-carboxylate dehydrogenase